MSESVPAVYKVLLDGASCHGGSLSWSLPAQNDDGTWTPGEWAEVHGPLVPCENGLHLTAVPAEWYQAGASLYLAEYDGEMIAVDVTKSVVRRARLLSEVDWSDHQVVHEGAHTVTSGTTWAYGTATVVARGTATVKVSGNATVRASGRVTVEASGNATVRASGRVTVEASGSATVQAFDSATVQASDDAIVRAYESATVWATGNATVWGVQPYVSYWSSTRP